MEICRLIRSEMLNGCFENTHGSNYHGEAVWAVHYLAHADIWVTSVALTHNKSSGEGAGRLAEVTDSRAGLLQDRLLCCGSGATSVWQWCDTKSLPVREVAGRPPIKTRRLGVTFHRPQLLGHDSMPAHYSWRVVCLARVISKGMSLQELCMSVCVCALVRQTHLSHPSQYLTNLEVTFYTDSL